MGRDDTLCAGEFNRLELRPGGHFMVTPATRGYACFDVTPCAKWLPFVDTYRTLCTCPSAELRLVLDAARNMRLAA